MEFRALLAMDPMAPSASRRDAILAQSLENRMQTVTNSRTGS